MNPYVMMQFLALGGILVAAAWLAIWSRRQTMARHVAMLMLVAGLGGVAATGVESAGFPKPIRWAWELNGEYRVLTAKLVQDTGIYLYVDSKEMTPRSYSLPWSNEKANQLQKLMDSGENGQFAMQFEWSWDQRKSSFYALPQPIVRIPKKRQDTVPRFEQGA
jgi:hypothetical protein